MKRVHSLVSCVCFLLFAGSAFGTVGGGDLTFNPPGAKPVHFSHAAHVNDKHKKCSACHYHLFQMEKGSYKMDMSKITKGQFCGSCHNGERSFSVSDKASCSKCHK